MKLKHLVLVSSLALSLAGNTAWAVENMRFGHGLPEDHAVHKAIAKFADLVKERSNGEIVIMSESGRERERYALSFHLDDENLDPKTWCRFPILSGGFERELAELVAAVKNPG